MEELTNFNQLEIGEQYRLLITYKGNNEEDWLSCDIVTEIVNMDNTGMMCINTMLTNSSYYWPIGKDEFQLMSMLTDYNIEFQKL